MWLGTSVFDGARWFEGVAPDLDLHAKRVNASAIALGLKPTMTVDEIVGLTWDGLKKFDGKTAVYIRPMYWAEHGGYMGVPAEPASTRFCLCLYESPMISPAGFSITVSPFRRPSLETMPTNAKAGCLYPNNGRAILEAKMRGFDNALVLDMLGNVAETGTSNIFLVKDGQVVTPVANGTFLSGITRARAIALLAEQGIDVVERTVSRARVPGGRRDLLDRQPFQGRAGDPHRGPQPAARAGRQEGARALLGMGAFDARRLSH